MLKIQPKQHIRFATIEKPTMWVVVAVLVETKNGESFVVSKPKVVKVILKEKQLKLTGRVSSKSYCLSIGKCDSSIKQKGIISPFVSFLHTQSPFIVWFSARPPTL
ncbi:MAG: hypothetical protein HQ402_02395 [Parcubacteria group bacterium]|nr:hypothetical protein [Parcubacteria group bacterium]